MGKTIIINLTGIDIKGDILDVGEDPAGVMYNFSKEAEQELSLDYVDKESRDNLKTSDYDICTYFFELNKLWTAGEKEKIIQETLPYIKDDGEILIWDINKMRGRVFNNKIKVILPKGKVREFNFKNMNLLSESNIEDTKKIIEKYFDIEESRSWEDIFFIHGKKKLN